MATTTLVGQEEVWAECVRQFDYETHLFLTGPAGSGKSTLARELMNYYARLHHRPHASQWGVESVDECLLLGPDQDRGIQTIRGQVSLFIRQMSIGDSIHRWVVIDDVDTFPHISQQALRRPMESYSHITRFLFIGSSEEDLIPPLRSRCIHLSMNHVDPMVMMQPLLRHVHMPQPEQITLDMWNWITAISNNNMGDLIRLLRFIRDVGKAGNHVITLPLIRTLCSAPYYMDFIPLLTAMSSHDLVASTRTLIQIWHRGYTYEDILESLQTIQQLFSRSLGDTVLVHKFLINAWISYCKGNTSMLALQNVIYKTLSEEHPPITAMGAPS